MNLTFISFSCAFVSSPPLVASLIVSMALVIPTARGRKLIIKVEITSTLAISCQSHITPGSLPLTAPNEYLKYSKANFKVKNVGSNASAVIVPTPIPI